ncbi:MAG: ABC transporter permease [Bilophila wadsworthia]|nr:ABC transporter permease [Bilophila wadsworthia]
MKTAGKERESGRCGEVPCEGSFKPIAGSGERGFAGEPPCRSTAGAAPEGRSRGNSSRAFGSLAGTWLSKRRILPCLLPLILFTCWNLATSSGLAPEYLLPSPRTVWETVCAYMGAVSEGYADAYAGRFWGDLSASLGRVGSGYLLAVIPGVALGLASGRSPALASLLSPIINGVRAVPGISWLPLALLWLGIGFRATVFLIALAGFFPAYLNAAAGAASVPPVLIRAGRMLGFGRRAIFFRVVIPSAMPQVRTGLRVALGMSFSYLVLGELTGVPDGLGAMIMDARLAGRVDLLVSGIILIALVGWLCDVLLMRALSAVSVSLRRQ